MQGEDFFVWKSKKIYAKEKEDVGHLDKEVDTIWIWANRK